MGVSGASDIFLHIQAKRAGKLKGESTSKGHEDDIEVSSWQWGVSSATAIGSSQATARRSYKALTIVKHIDAASTALMSALATNDELKQVKLSMRKAGDGQLDYWIITLEQARITSVDHHSDASSDTTEVVNIAFQKIDVQYRPQRETGGLTGTFSFTDQILGN